MTEDGHPMGFKLTGPFRCGACGKPRGLGVHLCSPGSRRRRRTTLRNPVTWECGTCGKPRGLRHTCTQRTDFKARRRRQATEERRRRKRTVRERRAARRKQAAADRRSRDRARKQAAKVRPRQPRTRGESHEPGTCGDRECSSYRCRIYWRGMADCPGPHEGD